MKNSTIKLLCIFIMIMYCLVPIGAIDLNQDSNAALKNLNDIIKDTAVNVNNDTTNTSINDINEITIKDINNTPIDDINKNNSKIDIEKINNTDNDTKKENNNELEELKYDPIIVDIPDINYGQNPKIYIHVPNHKDGNVYITCPQFAHEYKQYVEYYYHGIVEQEERVYEVTLNEKLEPGKYKVKCHYEDFFHTYYQHNQTDYISFKVKLNADPNLNVQINNMTQGEKLNIKVSGNESMDGITRVKINNVGTFSVQAKNGTGEQTFNNAKLAPGNYTATATYLGSCLFKETEVKTNFTVKEDLNPKVKTYMAVHVDNVLEGDDAKVKISANEAFNAPVKLAIKLNDYTMESTVNVANGVGETSISNLSPGTYAALVTFDGNDNFTQAVNSTGFTVKKRDDPGLSIHVENNTIAGKTDIEVGGNPNLANPVKIKLNNSQEYSLKLENGSGTLKTGTLTIDDLASGDYTATVTYDGDNDYKRGEVSTKFTKKGNVDPKFQIHINETLPGYKPVVEINCNKSFNGKVDISCPQFQQGYEVDIKDGHAQITLDKEANLAEGVYTVSFKYDGDYTFKPNEASTTFKVAKTTPNLSIDAGAVGYSGSSAMIYIKANELMDDDVKVKIKSGNYEAEETVKVVDGEGEVSFGGLSPGTYSATVSFDGNNILEKGSANTSFIIQRHF